MQEPVFAMEEGSKVRKCYHDFFYISYLSHLPDDCWPPCPVPLLFHLVLLRLEHLLNRVEGL